jgi:deazaflavin-dependent oxidoreductase (nitroreductase family)
MADDHPPKDRLGPQDYSSRTAYRRPGEFYRRVNRSVGVWVTSIGLGPKDSVTLKVRGRKSGKLRRLPILRTPHEGVDYLVSLAGESEWVRNVRAANGETVIQRGRARRAHVVELPAADRPEIISAYLRAAKGRSSEASYAKQAQFYFGLPTEPSDAEIADVAEYYPVFRIDYLG